MENFTEQKTDCETAQLQQWIKSLWNLCSTNTITWNLVWLHLTVQNTNIVDGHNQCKIYCK